MFCYHYDVDQGTCRKCGSAVAVTTGHAVTVRFGAPSRADDVTEAMRYVPGPVTGYTEALASVLGVDPSGLVLLDVKPDGEYWDRRVLVSWTLKGSNVKADAAVTMRDANRNEPYRTECDDENRPLSVAEA